ncbi:MAG: hypothetical protein M3239_05285 [Thermoproteota archaeon]|nr:hypothetical protein [Thermoproteota archaeon]
MEGILLLGRPLLAGILLIASLTKLNDRAQTRQSHGDLGIPPSLASPVSVLLPFAKLAIGLAPIPTATALRGALGALALLAVSTSGIGINLAQGRKPDCKCFGQLYSRL